MRIRYIKFIILAGLAAVWVMVALLELHLAQQTTIAPCEPRTQRDMAGKPTTQRIYSQQRPSDGLFGVSKNFGDNATISAPREDRPVVPNTVHFVFFSSRNNKTFTLLNALAVISAAKYIKPSVIYVHGDQRPRGEWWDRVERSVPTLSFSYTRAPQQVFGRKVKFVEHATDIARLQILLEYGGIYMDFDVISLRSFEELRHYPCVLEQEGKGYALANGVIIAEPGSKFLQLWYEAYRAYKPTPWGQYSVMMAWRIRDIFPFLVHVVYNQLIVTQWEQSFDQFTGHWANDSATYSHHIWERVGLIPKTLDELNVTDNAVGEMMRYVYYGSSALPGSRNNTLSATIYKDKGPMVKGKPVPTIKPSVKMNYAVRPLGNFTLIEWDEWDRSCSCLKAFTQRNNITRN